MTDKAKHRALELAGAVISFALPAGAAIAAFPRVVQDTGGLSSFAALLNLSTAALSIILIIGLLTAFRFFRDRIRMPKSGLALSAVLYLMVHGINVIVDPVETILFWSMIGCGIAWIFYLIADKKYGGNSDE